MTIEENILFSDALTFATRKHSHEQRKNGVPYIYHPIKVAMELTRKGYDVRYQIVGLFHDLLEDTDATEEEIMEFCDEEMFAAIKCLTKTEGIPESEYIEAVLKMPMAKIVKNEDRMDNIAHLYNVADSKFQDRYLKSTRELFVHRFSEELDELYESVEKQISENRTKASDNGKRE